MTGSIDWTAHSGDAWVRRWRELDTALEGIAVALDSAILANAPHRPFRAFDIGCGAGTTSLALAGARPDARIVACDISPPLADLARHRLAGCSSVTVELGDAPQVALREQPIDLFYSRHGVMFFPDPVAAFAALRCAAAPGATLVFSCFREWASNPWAGELAAAAAGRPVPPPGREAGGFAFADPDYVRSILGPAGWADCAHSPVDFRYRAGSGDQALEFLAEVGPASRELMQLPDEERIAALERMRTVLDRWREGEAVVFPAAAWIWTARAADG